ncbi:hypothetical protein POF51_18755 [Brevibacillus sp. AG]|uniref:DUF4275 family protein n=1 Tax=Brevibacillus sp. AG TaxID=3020891 RepID=UPI00232DF5C7|nr:DUF4275 family protein [Brevibacillus sp. AG]MDC0762759.1 hypothetical protein [Brevibacillus sp. AG]
MDLMDMLINKKIKFRPIPQWGTYLRREWENTNKFDPNKIVDRATYEAPMQQPMGIRHVLVNGKITVSDGRLTNVTSAR